MTKKIMVVAGGTGGHIFPGIAVAQALKEQGWQAVWLGTSDRMEAQVVPKHGIDIRFINVKGVRGNGVMRLIKAPFMVMKAIYQAIKVLRDEKPDVVLGMGGYVTGPAGVAARMLGIPLVVHEQNAVAGMSNKLLARMATKVLAAFPSAFSDVDATVVGNPVRKSVANIEPRVPTSYCHILVVGGSLGAKALNEQLPEVFEKLQTTRGLKVWHQTGKGNQAAVEGRYQEAALEAEVSQFIDDMDKAYDWADMVICRAGALTVSEIAAAGKMAVFIPLPHAVDDHQAANANYLVKSGGALLMPQKEMNTERLVALLQPYLSNPEKINDMANKAKQLAKLDATDQVVAHCIELSE